MKLVLILSWAVLLCMSCAETQSCALDSSSFMSKRPRVSVSFFSPFGRWTALIDLNDRVCSSASLRCCSCLFPASAGRNGRRGSLSSLRHFCRFGLYFVYDSRILCGDETFAELNLGPDPVIYIHRRRADLLAFARDCAWNIHEMSGRPPNLFWLSLGQQQQEFPLQYAPLEDLQRSPPTIIPSTPKEPSTSPLPVPQSWAIVPLVCGQQIPLVSANVHSALIHWHCG